MTLAELATAWNDLRNAALGRGTSPRVPRELADRVGKRYEAFRQWYESAWSLEDWVPSVTAAQSVRDFRALADEVRAAGRPVADLPATPIEQGQRAFVAVVDTAETIGRWVLGLALAIGGAAGVIAIARSRGNR